MKVLGSDNISRQYILSLIQLDNRQQPGVQFSHTDYRQQPGAKSSLADNLTMLTPSQHLREQQDELQTTISDIPDPDSTIADTLLNKDPTTLTKSMLSPGPKI